MTGQAGPRASRLSIVVPTWCEAAVVQAAVISASRVADEVVVADANSPDGTAAAAKAAGAIVVSTRKGRGQQLHDGAQAASGEVLLFLHADSLLPPDARSAVLQAMASPAVVGGNFRLRFASTKLAAKAFELGYHLRRRAFGIYYGDSAIFVRRSVYFELGGFRPMPIFEDYDFARRLERAGPTAYLSELSVTTSARRFDDAPWRSLLRWTSLQVAYSLGVAPGKLARMYRDAR